jgi:hypothetical protein
VKKLLSDLIGRFCGVPGYVRRAINSWQSGITSETWNRGIAIHFNRHSAIHCLVMLAVLSAISDATADTIAQNAPVTPFTDPVTGRQVRNGIFSDGLSSNGNYYYSQALGQKFTVGAGQRVTIGSIDFWGSSEYINSQTPWTQTTLSTNVYAIQISILRLTPGNNQYPLVWSWVVNTPQITQMLTGTYLQGILSPVFQLSTALSGDRTLLEGEYMLTIGGLLNNAEADVFAWTDGQADGSLPATQAYATVGDIPTEWGRWYPVGDGTSGAFVLRGTVMATQDPDHDGLTGSQDNCPNVYNPDQRDCNNNGTGEACETFTDCNESGLPDSCDIAAHASADSNDDGVPDECQSDCNHNGIVDMVEIRNGSLPDRNADHVPDTCQGAMIVTGDSGNLGPPSGDDARSYTFANLPYAANAVVLTVSVCGDLDGASEYIAVSLNGGIPQRFFEAGGNDCPATPDRATITLTTDQFRTLIAGTNALTVTMTCPATVDPTECKASGLTQFTLMYVGIDAQTGDCNDNDLLDIYETYDGTSPDCNSNGVPDSCDFERGGASDCNLNGVLDGCEIAANQSIDCDQNGQIDTCEIVSAGTDVDCDQNGRIDRCQVADVSGIDCNSNLKPDSCDIASGLSLDRDANRRPDECQTVTVPGIYGSIQAAIDAAPANEMRIISVSAGTYDGPIAFNGKPVIVRGTSAASTVIAGNGGQQLSVVRFTGGEPAIAALERVTVRGGTTGTPIPNSPTALGGGGIFGIDSAASVRDCVVEQNAGGFGGGAYFLRCTGEVRGTNIRNNSASSDGGGFQQNQGSQKLTDVVIEGNTCNSRGGGMHLVQGNPTLTRVAVRNNYSNNLIGGISWYALGSATATAALDACAVTGNGALVTQGGVGISAPNTGTPTISLRGTNVCNNTPRPNVSGAWADLGGNSICDCAGDLNLDGLVNGADLGLMLSSWGPCGTNCPYDINADGQVNGADLGLVLSAWGTCGN